MERGLWPEIKECLNEQGLQFDLVTTARAGEAVELARRATEDGYETIVAAGGDGTYQEVINGMLAGSDDEIWATWALSRSDRDATLRGRLACLRIWQRRARAWRRGQTRIVDVGKVTVDAMDAGTATEAQPRATECNSIL